MHPYSLITASDLSTTNKILLALLGFIVITVFLLTNALPQNPEYHQFADQRKLIEIPHALDVLSNLPFCLFGALGIGLTLSRRRVLQTYTLAYLSFFTAILLTGFGSGYYHLNPNDDTLVWDRLPMAVSFMSLFAIIVAERIKPTLGLGIFPWMVATGIASVLYWHWLDDLRPYVLVQFGTLVAIPIILLRYRQVRSGLLWLAIACYLAAKLLEFYDWQIFNLTREWVSGHTFKHVVASMAPALILVKLHYQSRIDTAFDAAAQHHAK